MTIKRSSFIVIILSTLIFILSFTPIYAEPILTSTSKPEATFTPSANSETTPASQISTSSITPDILFVKPTHPPKPSLPSLPTRSPRPTIPKFKMNRNTSAVEIVSPEDQIFTDRSQPLEVRVKFNARNLNITIGDKEKKAYVGMVRAVELLLDGKSIEVKQLKPAQKEGEVIFNVSFNGLPENAEKAQLQARIYEFYIPQNPKLPPFPNHSIAESDIVTVLFKQIVGPEGGIANGENGVNDVSVTIPQGALSSNIPVTVSMDLDAWEKTLPSADEGIMLGVINLDLGGAETSLPMDIDMPAPDNITDDDQVLVVEILNDNNAIKYQLTDLARLENGRLASQFINLPFTFPQIFKGGIFGFFITKKNVDEKAEIGYVKGVVRGIDGNPLNGAIVTISNLSLFVSKTNAKGEYLIPSIVGSFSVTAFDPQSGNFKTVSGAVPTKGGGVIIDIQLSQESLPLNSNLINGGFESDLNNWTNEGQVYVISSLGPLFPQEGGKMLLMTTGALSVNKTFSTLKQKFMLPSGAQKLTFMYDFISREYPHYVGSRFNDQFEANLLTKNGTLHIESMEVNSDKANFQPINVGFPSEDPNDGNMGHTGWRTAEINVSQLDGVVVLAFTASDVGDTIFDTGVLIDNIKLISTNGEVKFLSSPLPGIAVKDLPINSVFDHDGTKGTVVAFTGEKGHRKPPPPIGSIECMPNVEKNGSVSKDFVLNGHYLAAGNPKNQLCYDSHDAIDFETKGNIIAAADGQAILDWDDSVQAAWHKITIKYDNGYKTKYLHLNTSPLKDANGKNKGVFPDIKRGDVIGTAGNWSGCWSDEKKAYIACKNPEMGVHLHFGVENPQGQKVDPYGWSGSYTDPMIPNVKNINLWLE